MATGLVCAGLCAWHAGGVARAQDATPTPTITPAPLNTEQGEGALPKEHQRATPSPQAERRPRHDRPRRRRARPTPAAPAPPAGLDVPVPLGLPLIPAFLLPIYKAAGSRYGVPWEILAGINEIETDYGRNLSVSSAGAIGWMQFMPESWERYGLDANADGVRDPYNPDDAIFSAARYLQAAGAAQDLRAAIWAYNHADWYVDSVLERAARIVGLPEAEARVVAAKTPTPEVAPAAPRPRRRGLTIPTRPGSVAVAVESGTVVALRRDVVSVRSAAGSVVSYVGLTSAARTYPAARRTPLALPGKRRLFAHPSRLGARAPAVAHSHDELLPLPRLVDRPPLSRRDYVVRWLNVGSSIQAGTVLGRAAREPRPQARLARSPARPVAAEVR